MRKKLIALLFVCSIAGFSQVNAYGPDGKKIVNDFKTIGELLDSLGVKERTIHIQDDVSVYYKKLTNKAICIIGLNNPKKIKKILSSYDYDEYLNSYSYYYDLKSMMEESKLTEQYLNEVFGPASEIIKGEDKRETWIYKNHNAKIEFYNHHVYSVNVINYKVIEKNNLAINSYEVNGEDYSIGFEISVTNFNVKTIKYIYITVTAKNPVKDKVGTRTVTAIGPIEYFQSGSYEFENVFFSNTAQYLNIDQIKIQYMDGSKKTIPKTEIDKITLVDWEEYGNRRISY